MHLFTRSQPYAICDSLAARQQLLLVPQRHVQHSGNRLLHLLRHIRSPQAQQLRKLLLLLLLLPLLVTRVYDDVSLGSYTTFVVDLFGEVIRMTRAATQWFGIMSSQMYLSMNGHRARIRAQGGVTRVTQASTASTNTGVPHTKGGW